jgi:hypothetical protein
MFFEIEITSLKIYEQAKIDSKCNFVFGHEICNEIAHE